MKRIKTLQTVIFVALGWGFLATWADLFGHSPGFAVPYSSLIELGNMRLYWLAGLLILAASFAAAPKWFEQWQRYIFYCMPLAASFGTMSFAVACQQSFFPPEIVAVVGIVVSGAAYTWFTCLFCKLLAQSQRMAHAIISIVAGLMLKTIFVQISTSVLSESLQVGFAIVLPLVVVVCLMVAERGESTHIDRDEWKPSLQNKTGYRYLIPQFIVAIIALATVRVITPLGFFGDPLQLFNGAISTVFGTVGVCAVLALVSYFALVKRSSVSLSKRFIPAFLIVIFAFFISAFSPSYQGFVAAMAEVFITAAEALTHALFWTFAVTAIRLNKTSPFRVVGLAAGLYDVLSIVWVAFFFTLGVVNNAIILAVAFTLVLLLIWLIDRGGNEAAPPPNMVVDRRVEIAQRYALSPRETDVFMMLAQGRSRSYISDDLVLSEGTIKTHISHIYVKLGVSNRQEMFDLLLEDAQNVGE